MVRIKKTGIIVCVLFVCLLSGCASKYIIQEKEELGHDRREMVDSIGRTIMVPYPDEIDSISALYTVTGHIAIMLDKGDIITSCSKGLKRDKLILNMEPHIQDILMPKSSGVINMEELLNSDPDLVFLDTPAYWGKMGTEKLDKLKIPYFVIEFNSIEDEKYAVKTIGNILGEEAEAESYIKFYDQMLQIADDITKKIPEDIKWKVYHSINEVTRTSAPNTLPAEWLERAGGINVALEGDLEKEEDKFYTTVEDIMYWNPEVILVNEPGTYEYIMSREEWQNIDAVLNSRVHLMPTGISRWGHATSLETPLAIVWTLKTLYPEYSEDIDLIALTREFYTQLFEYELSESEIEQILSGMDMRKAKTLKD